MAEAKDAELERVLAANARLRQDLASLQHVRMVHTPLVISAVLPVVVGSSFAFMICC